MSVSTVDQRTFLRISESPILNELLCCSVTLLVAALDAVDGNDAPRPGAKPRRRESFCALLPATRWRGQFRMFEIV